MNMHAGGTQSVLQPVVETGRIQPVLPKQDLLLEASIPRFIRVGDLSLDLLLHTTHKDGKQLMLPKKPFLMLVLMSVCASMGRAATRPELSRWVGNNEELNSHSLEMAISRTRAELALVNSCVSIQTIRHGKKKGVPCYLLVVGTSCGR